MKTKPSRKPVSLRTLIAIKELIVKHQVETRFLPDGSVQIIWCDLIINVDSANEAEAVLSTFEIIPVVESGDECPHHE